MMRVLVLFAMALPVLAQQAKPVDKKSHSWAKWKAGSKLEMKDTFGKDAGEESLHILKSSTDEDLILTVSGKWTSNGFSGESPARDVTRRLANDLLFRDPNAKKSGQETLKIDGTEYKCTIFKSTFEEKPDKSVAIKYEITKWIAPKVDVPLKIVTKTNSGTGSSTEEILAVSLADEIEVVGKKLKCVKCSLKRDDKAPDETITTVGFIWLTPEIPSGIARWEKDLPQHGETLHCVHEVMSFEAKK